MKIKKKIAATLLGMSIVATGLMVGAPAAEAAQYKNNCWRVTTWVGEGGFVYIRSKHMNGRVIITGGGQIYGMTVYVNKSVAIDIDHYFTISC